MTDNMNAVSYCVGMSIAASLMDQNLREISPEILTEAIKDAFEGKAPKYAPEEANAIIQAFLAEEGEKQFAQNKTQGEAFLDENKNRNEVQMTLSGLQYEILVAAEGEKPAATDTVTVHYHGTLIDGTVFDSSVQRGQPASFGVHQVIPGWTEALQLMPKGSKYRLYIPQELAYGAHPHPGGPIQPYSALIFDVELLEIA
jgi:FKBP-type peptidyl-prolyl cis-trans isomerase FklB